ncbi:MAG: bifunctional diguanylate cyclase/phosphodiesterase [Cellvibrionales bacterium]|nr:bifunctional diguanylate cyclase/phosphodiesterase [Cellvibrionales bacterium]
MHKVEMADLLLSIVKESILGILALDNTGKVVISNDKALKILNISQPSKTLEGDFLFKYIHHLPQLMDWIADYQVSATQAGVPDIQKQLLIESRVFRLKISQFMSGFLLSFEDVTKSETQKKLLSKTSEKLAALKEQWLDVDFLTKIPNRYHFLSQAEQLINHLSNQESLCLFIFDLTGIDKINDTLGHDAGDQMLCFFSQQLKKVSYTHADLYARLGGDKFCLLHKFTQDSDWIYSEFEEELRRELSISLHIESFEAAISYTSGASLYPLHAKNINDLFKYADIALKQSKTKGQASLYSEQMQTLSRFHLKLNHEIKQAKTLDQFVLYLQPKLDLKTNKITAAEGLIRWQHPEFGLLLPKDFMPMVEQSGIVHDFFLKTLDLAIAHIINLNRQIQVAINLSSKNLYATQLADEVATRLHANNIPPDRLCIELTETAIMANDTQVLTSLDKLQSLGISLALDDFGTGYSSLSHIKSLPINHIKIDRSFVSQMTTSTKDRMIIQSTIELAKNLGLEVTIEGVETRNQLNIVRKMHADFIQGYHLAKAEPLDIIEKFIQQHNNQADS